MKLDTVGDIQGFLRHTTAKAKHHASYALPIMGTLLMCALTLADRDSLATFGPAGRQLRFLFRGVKFKLRHRPAERVIVLQEVLGTSEGPVLAVFQANDWYELIESKLRDALVHAVAMKAATRKVGA